VVDFGTFLGMGGKSVAVKCNDLKTDNNRLTLDATKEQAANGELQPARPQRRFRHLSLPGLRRQLGCGKMPRREARRR
jgi:hypothetical protein